MKMVRLSERVWYYPYEPERDRPNLGYVKGDNWALAVDAGHSAAHTEEFCVEARGTSAPAHNSTYSLALGSHFWNALSQWALYRQ